MNTTSKRLLAAGRDALMAVGPDCDELAPIVAAVLRELSESLYDDGTAAIEPEDLVRLADDIEGGGK